WAVSHADEKDRLPQSELQIRKPMSDLKFPAHVLFRKELSLMVWKPHGILDQALVNEIVAFVEAAEERAQKPFKRFVTLSALHAVDLNFMFVFHIALHRRLAFDSHPPIKTAFYVTPATAHY